MPGGIRQRLRALQVAVSSIVLGMLPLGAILLLTVQPADSGAGLAVLEPVAIGLALLALPVWLLVRNLLQRSAVVCSPGGRPDDATWHQLIGRYSAICLIGAALLEASALFSLLMYALSRGPWMLALAIGAAVAVLFMFPTQGNFSDFAERARRAR